MVVCDGRYDSHAFVWESGRHVCARCGLVDLSAARWRRAVLAALLAKLRGS